MSPNGRYDVTDDQFAQPTDDPIDAGPVGADPMSSEDPPQYGVGPFTIREVALLGVWLAAFVVSFFPVYTEVVGRAIGGGLSVWMMGLDWILTIGVPTAAVFLVVLRRFSPQGIRRVGSLGIDQFASVAFSVSATVWLVALWHNIAVVISDGVWVRTWVVWVEFFLMLAGVVLTVVAPLIPVLAEDFRGRPETPAHRNARPVRAVPPRPPRPKPAPSEPVGQDPYAPVSQDPHAPAGREAVDADAMPLAEGTFTAEEAYPPAAAEPAAAEASARPEPLEDDLTVTGAYRALGFDGERQDEPVADDAAAPQYARGGAPAETEVQPEPQRTAHQAFWALAPEERDVHDEHGVPIFRIGPTAWALVIEDRGSLFVIRHEDGRIGYLHDVTGITRG